MKAVRLKTRLASDTLTVSSPELKPFVGMVVEIIVCEEETASVKAASGYGFMKGSVLRDDEPFSPAVPPEDWESDN